MQLSAISLALTRAGYSIFTPSSIFTTGVNGAWYDPSDLTTLYRDAAGTLPVTAVEQPVGRMLDKSGRGNHAFNSSGNSANFPVLSARYNLLTKTEQFDDAAWLKAAGVTVSANTDVAPNGTTTADTITSGGNEIGQSISCAANTTYTDSVYFKKTTGAAYTPSLYLLFTGGTTAIYAVRLNTDTGVATAVSAGGFTAPSGFSVFDAGSYWLLSISGSSTNNTTATLRVYANMNASAGSGAGSQVIWGADLRVANDALNQPAYQRVNTATDYDTVGFKPYLRFNGVSQWLQTNSIDFTYGDKMFVSAGVRKLSDANAGLITELSTAIGSNAGSFYIFAGDAGGGGTPKYATGSRGTSISSTTTTGTYAAPITNVLSGIYSISGDISRLRINGVQDINSTTDQGTGNYGNYPMFVGARAGTSLYFNGRLYQLVVIGKQASSGEIASTEAFVATKTGVTL